MTTVEPWDLATYKRKYDELMEIARRQREDAARYQRLATLLDDLDRCPHGRHRGDVCGGVTGCNGPSKGNPLFKTGDVIGYTIRRQPIVIPDRDHMHDPDSWLGGDSAITDDTDSTRKRGG